MQNTDQLHIVLGGSGAIGQAVLNALNDSHVPTKAVERKKDVPGTETIIADLLDKEATSRALQGATHVYVCVGLPYNTKLWEAEWPAVIANVIDACAEHHAKLIFFDNIYMYGPAPLPVPFDETTSQHPNTKKGILRKAIADTVLDAHRSGKVQALIARSADFYGPLARNSSLYTAFTDRILLGKNPQWVGSPHQQHTYAYSLDNGRAVVQLATDDSTYGEVWHLPAGAPITIEEILEIINKELGTAYTISFMPRFLLSTLSLFVPILREVKEMVYQFDTPYELSWQKFHQKFPDFVPTTNQEGITAMIRSFGK